MTARPYNMFLLYVPFTSININQLYLCVHHVYALYTYPCVTWVEPSLPRAKNGKPATCLLTPTLIDDLCIALNCSLNVAAELYLASHAVGCPMWAVCSLILGQKEWRDVKSGFKDNTPSISPSFSTTGDRSSWGKVWCIRPVPMRITSKQYPRVFLLGQVLMTMQQNSFGERLKNNQKISKKHLALILQWTFCGRSWRVQPHLQWSMQRGLPLRQRWEFASSYRSFFDPVRNTSQQTLLTTSVQACKITTKHDNGSIRCCLSFCVPQVLPCPMSVTWSHSKEALLTTLGYTCCVC